MYTQEQLETLNLFQLSEICAGLGLYDNVSDDDDDLEKDDMIAFILHKQTENIKIAGI